MFRVDMRTMKAIDEAGHDLRVWCFRCARGSRIDGGIWPMFQERGWTLELPGCARHFSCQTCRRSDQVLVVPATRADQTPWTATRFVAAYFHGMRSARKKSRRG